MTAPALAQKLWNCCNIVRDGDSPMAIPALSATAAEFVADLEAAFEQFTAIEEDLKRVKRNENREALI